MFCDYRGSNAITTISRDIALLIMCNSIGFVENSIITLRDSTVIKDRVVIISNQRVNFSIRFNS